MGRARRVLAGGRLRAVTLIEAVLFISIALGLIVGGLVFFQQATLSARVTSQARSVASIVAELRNLLRNVETTDSVLDPLLIAAGAVPAEQVAATPTDVRFLGVVPSSLLTSWGTPLSAYFTAGGEPDAGTTQVRIALFGLPVEACSRLSIVTEGGSGVAVGTSRVTWRAPRAAYDLPVTGVRHVYIGELPGNPQANSDLTVLEVTPSYAAATCAEFAVDGRVEVILSYFIDTR